MLHGILNELGNCLDVRDDTLEKTNFHMFSDKFLASGAFIVGIIVKADNSPWNCVTDAINKLIIT